MTRQDKVALTLCAIIGIVAVGVIIVYGPNAVSAIFK